MSAINLSAPPAAPIDTTAGDIDQDQLFTCLSCAVAFLSPDEQREHMRSDWHRYNMKRRVATLPPVSAALFNRKIIERRNENAVTATKTGETCKLCSKAFASQGAYRTHVESKKHRDAEIKEATRLLRGGLALAEQPSDEVASHDPTTSRNPHLPPVVEAAVPAAPAAPSAPSAPSAPAAPTSTASHVPFVQPTTTNLIISHDSYAPSAASTSHNAPPPSLAVPVDATDEEIEQSIDAKIAYARTRLTPTSCLFCSHTGESTETLVEHMQLTHGFFIPDREYLVDLKGLLLYLSEKVAIGNVCLFCNGKGKEYKSMDAVRKHMIDKSHCKLAYSHEVDRLELSDYYDFSSSYPDHETRRKKSKAARRAQKLLAAVAEEEDWMEASDVESDADEVMVDATAENDDDDDDNSDAESDDSSLSDLDPASGIRFDPDACELVLPNGRRLGHRSLQRYYNQRPTFREAPEPGPGRRSITDKTDQALIARRGGFGDFGEGGEVIRARNKGEAKNATKNPYKAMQKRARFELKIGKIHNSQKHYRDPLLQ